MTHQIIGTIVGVVQDDKGTTATIQINGTNHPVVVPKGVWAIVGDQMGVRDVSAVRGDDDSFDHEFVMLYPQIREYDPANIPSYDELVIGEQASVVRHEVVNARETVVSYGYRRSSTGGGIGMEVSVTGTDLSDMKTKFDAARDEAFVQVDILLGKRDKDGKRI